MNENFKNLADEIKQIYVELSFSSRWSLIEMYHQIGEKLSSQPDVDLQQVSTLSGIGVRHLERSAQFYKKYPRLDLLPGGKSISWHHIVNELLPVHETKELAPGEPETGKIMVTCPNCGEIFALDRTPKG